MLQSPPLASHVVPVGGTYRETIVRLAGTELVTVPVLPRSIGAFDTIVTSPARLRLSRFTRVFLVGWVCQIAYVPVMFALLTPELKLDTAVAEVTDGLQGFGAGFG